MPVRMMLPFGSIPIRFITKRPSLFPRSSTRLSSSVLTFGLPLRAKGRAYHVPPRSQKGLGSVSSPDGCIVPVVRFYNGLSNHLPFWLKPISMFGLFILTGFIHSSRLLALPSSLAPFRIMLADSLYPHGLSLPLSRMGYIVLSASYRFVTDAAWDSRLLLRKQQVSSLIVQVKQ